MNTTNLRKGQRYLFYEKRPYEENETIFRANFVNLHAEKLFYRKKFYS